MGFDIGDFIGGAATATLSVFEPIGDLLDDAGDFLKDNREIATAIGLGVTGAAALPALGATGAAAGTTGASAGASGATGLSQFLTPAAAGTGTVLAPSSGAAAGGGLLSKLTSTLGPVNQLLGVASGLSGLLEGAGGQQSNPPLLDPGQQTISGGIPIPGDSPQQPIRPASEQDNFFNFLEVV